jgi:hypothetical protein
MLGFFLMCPPQKEYSGNTSTESFPIERPLTILFTEFSVSEGRGVLWIRIGRKSSSPSDGHNLLEGQVAACHDAANLALEPSFYSDRRKAYKCVTAFKSFIYCHTVRRLEEEPEVASLLDVGGREKLFAPGDFLSTRAMKLLVT